MAFSQKKTLLELFIERILDSYNDFVYQRIITPKNVSNHEIQQDLEKIMKGNIVSIFRLIMRMSLSSGYVKSDYLTKKLTDETKKDRL